MGEASFGWLQGEWRRIYIRRHFFCAKRQDDSRSAARSDSPPIVEKKSNVKFAPSLPLEGKSAWLVAYSTRMPWLRIIVLMYSMASPEVLPTVFTRFCTSSADIGVKSSLIFFPSDTKAGSAEILRKAAR